MSTNKLKKNFYLKSFTAVDLDLKEEKPYLNCSRLAFELENVPKFSFSFIIKMNSFGKKTTKIFNYGNNAQKSYKSTFYMYHTSRYLLRFKLVYKCQKNYFYVKKLYSLECKKFYSINFFKAAVRFQIIHA